MSDSILYSVENGVAKITLNRPEVFNSFNREMALLLQQQLDKSKNDASVRAILLTGSGKAFCAGQDLSEVVSPERNPGFKTILDEHYNPIIKRLRSIKKPVLAAVNGVAAGAGANIALACDVVVAHTHVSFIQAFSKIGLIPDSAGTFFLPRLIGFQKASALMMLADKISAEEAERIGMIYKVVSPESFETETKALSIQLASMPTHALGLLKDALNKTFANTLDDQLALESKYQIEAAQTEDYKEGVSAFIEKRSPKFKGQ